MTLPAARVIWAGTTSSGTFRLVDMGAAAEPRFRFEQQMPPDAMGGQGWQTIGLPYGDVLEQAFLALVPVL